MKVTSISHGQALLLRSPCISLVLLESVFSQNTHISDTYYKN